MTAAHSTPELIGAAAAGVHGARCSWAKAPVTLTRVAALTTDEPRSHGTSFVSSIAAARHLWGEHALSAIAERLKPDTRRVTLQEPLLAVSWYPSWMLIDWCQSVWDGPARQRESVYAAFVDRGLDLGWSKMRRVFVGMLTPGLLATRAAKEWRNEHTHGSVDVVLGERGGTATFRDTPFVEVPVMQLTLAESFRHLASLSRISNVRESHCIDGGRLVVDLVWH
jgi:hypothetical protein